MAYKKRKPEVNYFINELEQLSYLINLKKEKELELEVVENSIYGLPKRSIDIPPDCQSSNLPMPTVRRKKTFNYDMVEKKDKLIKEILMLKLRIEYVQETIAKLKKEKRKIINDLYIHKKPLQEVSDKYGYTKKGMLNYINGFLNEEIGE